MDRLLLVYTAPARAPLPTDWCDHEHVPAHLGGAVPAVLSCTRWAAADNKTPAHLSLYDLRLTPTTSASAPPSPARSDGEGGGGDAGRVPASAPPMLKTFDGAGPENSSDDSDLDTVVDDTEDAEVDGDGDSDYVQTRLYVPVLSRSRADFAPPSPSLPSPLAALPPASPAVFSSPPPPALSATDAAPDWRYITLTETELAPGAEKEYARWFDEEHVPLLARVPGWCRSRRFRLARVLSSSGSLAHRRRRLRLRHRASASSGESKRALGGGERGRCDSEDDECEGARERCEYEYEYEYGLWEDGRGARPPRVLAVHEWASLDAFWTPEFKRATSTPWRAQVLAEGRVLRYDIRVFRAADDGGGV